MEELEALKLREDPESGGKMKAWDGGYLKDIQMKEKFQIDNEQIKQYFPAEVIFERLL